MGLEIDELGKLRTRAAKREADLSELFSSLETLVEMLIAKEQISDSGYEGEADNTSPEQECANTSGSFSEDAENIVALLLSCLAQHQKSA
ncbi:hypothetical protein VKT23_000273 [Stygiomarasmius scandens]|uniref:Uncharacterized protein n=1 Tax=Marasmiellus scandens TaxID=2682957 RepID=A0ABR1K3M0_9AGAR